MFALFLGLASTVLLCAPAVVAYVEFNGRPELTRKLDEWLWMAASAPLLALWLVWGTTSPRGRLRGGRMRRARRPLAYLLRVGLLLGTTNVVEFIRLTGSGSTDSIRFGTIGGFGVTTLAGIGVLLASYWWDVRPEPVTVEEVRAAVRDADRALRQVRAENRRVRRQTEQVRQRLASAQSETDFRTLCTLHHESYRCADGAYVHFSSAQTSLRTMTSMLRRAHSSWHRPIPGRAAKAARAELRAATTHLVRSRGELRVHVDQGLGLVQTLNANTADLKYAIRENCGAAGQNWFEALEERISEARASRV